MSALLQADAVSRQFTVRAGMFRPSARVTSILSALCTTWLLVRMKPSGVKMKPEPLPRPPRRARGSGVLGWPLCCT